MKDALEGRTLLWAGILAVIVIINVAVSYRAVRTVSDNDHWVSHTLEITNELTTTLLLITDAESAIK